ncbi:hypothetical protein lerEdw1_012171, partial [Lerista edwardsae]
SGSPNGLTKQENRLLVGSQAKRGQVRWHLPTPDPEDWRSEQETSPLKLNSSLSRYHMMCCEAYEDPSARRSPLNYTSGGGLPEMALRHSEALAALCSETASDPYLMRCPVKWKPWQITAAAAATVLATGIKSHMNHMGGLTQGHWMQGALLRAGSGLGQPRGHFLEPTDPVPDEADIGGPESFLFPPDHRVEIGVGRRNLQRSPAQPSNLFTENPLEQANVRPDPVEELRSLPRDSVRAALLWAGPQRARFSRGAALVMEEGETAAVS